MEVQWQNNAPWFFTAIYASPRVRNRREFWTKIKDLAKNINGPWCLGGDFNSILSMNDTGGSSNFSLDTKYETIAIHEETYWQQMSRCDIIRFGDKNSKYFYSKANERCKRNKITALKSEEGEWVDNVDTLKTWGVNFFKNLYCSEFGYNDFAVSNQFPKLQDIEYQDIAKEVSSEELKEAVFSMGSWKAPESDGLPAKFYQQAWDKFKSGLIWRLENGGMASFWKEQWVPGFTKLSEVSLVELDENKLNEKVVDYVTKDGEWDWEALNMVLPEEVTDIIHTIKAPNPYVGDDFISWLVNLSGIFSVKSAYETFYRDRGEDNRLYKHIWKAKLPQRLNFLLPTMVHHGLSSLLLPTTQLGDAGMSLFSIIRIVNKP
ncbi:hypothetical protein Ahy_B05g079722 [Arachis hypogaea]|uniref:Reverse transcriptase zinc-binding domain-containing protein n=1 Tax=Arachis hypogaea TaxID=3818 RepID=A0A444ZAQ3_ARAHY|nr:hypothetical protein Ahy_B05g079722 [Arachis hypogaea]